MFQQEEVPTGIGWGIFWAIGAIAMAHQTFVSCRKGYMYCGVTEKVYRKHNPVKFKVWFVIQTISVLFFVTLSIYAFLN